MKPNELVTVVRRRVRAPRKGDVKTVVAVTAGVASAIWLALQIKRELYGPGGTKLSRHNRLIDKVWPRDGS
jgi:hypothetical protein